MSKSYRADIDGLRAVAVLSVVLFHAFPSALPGGFVGVDIFFVISGYLISNGLFEGLLEGRFDILGFYERRIRRIFPALLVVLTACLAAGWFLLLAPEYEQLGKHAAAGAAFASNLVLWSESGYFDAAAETKPLLHLWSLGIEEQFYLAWPLVLWAAWRMRVNVLATILALMGASFALNVSGIGENPVAAFYSPQTRFWELLAGAALAWLTVQGAIRWGARTANIIAWLGAVLIAAALALTPETGFPGWWALLPVCGAVLLIATGEKSRLGQGAFSHPVTRWFGRVSYPLYLWHWPFLAFAFILQGGEPSPAIQCAAVALAVVSAWLTYQYVEKPVRFGRFRASPRVAFALLAALPVIAIGGYAAYVNAGLPFRDPGNSMVAANEGEVTFDIQHYVANFLACSPREVRLASLVPGMDVPACFQSEPGAPTIALIGDSHALHLFDGLAHAATDENVFVSMRVGVPGDYENYQDLIGYLEGSAVGTVIISGYWASMSGNQEALYNGLSSMVRRLVGAGLRVYLVDDVPTFGTNASLCQGIRASGFDGRNPCIENAQQNQRQYAEYMGTLTRVAAEAGAAGIIKTFEIFCSIRTCEMARDGKLFYRDTNHLNLNGSALVAKAILGQL